MHMHYCSGREKTREIEREGERGDREKEREREYGKGWNTLKVDSIDIESLEQFIGGDNIDEGLLYTTAWSLRKRKVV